MCYIHIGCTTATCGSVCELTVHDTIRKTRNFIEHQGPQGESRQADCISSLAGPYSMVQ